MVQMQDLLAKSFRDFREGSIVKGRVLEIRPREVLVDMGYKWEGIIPSAEFDNIDKINDDLPNVVLSQREIIEQERGAKRQKFLECVTVGDRVTGTANRLLD